MPVTLPGENLLCKRIDGRVHAMERRCQHRGFHCSQKLECRTNNKIPGELDGHTPPGGGSRASTTAAYRRGKRRREHRVRGISGPALHALVNRFYSSMTALHRRLEVKRV